MHGRHNIWTLHNIWTMRAVIDRTRRTILLGGAVFSAAIFAQVLPSACAMRRTASTTGGTNGEPPLRPAGQPRPMIDEDITPILARLDAWYNAHLTDPRYRFNPPGDDAAIDRIATLTGLSLPQSYRQLYRWHDGENDDRWGHIYGLPLLPLRAVADTWSGWQKIMRQFGGNRYVVPAAAWPKDAIDPAYSNPGWLPLTSDGSGNHIGIDFDPWPKGRVGQIILFGRDEDVKLVLADSLGQFLEWIVGLLESGNFRTEPAQPGQNILRQFRLKTPAVDDFHDGARQLLHAPGPFI